MSWHELLAARGALSLSFSSTTTSTPHIASPNLTTIPISSRDIETLYQEP
jgi:hypothetical protein